MKIRHAELVPDVHIADLLSDDNKGWYSQHIMLTFFLLGWVSMYKKCEYYLNR
jgi:hypothetical protein